MQQEKNSVFILLIVMKFILYTHKYIHMRVCIYLFINKVTTKKCFFNLKATTKEEEQKNRISNYGFYK